jgi:hypothetical protein
MNESGTLGWGNVTTLEFLIHEFYNYLKATTRYLYVVCIYGAIHLQILFLKHHILLFCHEILKFFT